MTSRQSLCPGTPPLPVTCKCEGEQREEGVLREKSSKFPSRVDKTNDICSTASFSNLKRMVAKIIQVEDKW